MLPLHSSPISAKSTLWEKELSQVVLNASNRRVSGRRASFLGRGQSLSPTGLDAVSVLAKGQEQGPRWFRIPSKHQGTLAKSSESPTLASSVIAKSWVTLKPAIQVLGSLPSCWR